MNNVRTYRILQWLIPALVLLFGRGLLLNEWAELRASRSALRTEQKKIEQTGVHVRRLPDLKKDFENLAIKRVETSASLFDTDHQANIYEVLLVKAGENGVSLLNVSPGTARKKDGYDELPVSIELSGSYHALGGYLNVIESLNRLLRVQSISLRRERDGSLEASAEVIAYLYDGSGNEEVHESRARVGKTGSASDYMNALQKALAVAMTPPGYRYTPFGAEPFGTAVSGNRPGASAGDGRKTENSLRISLKGILWKEPPLAILEALDGKTWIVKKGDSVNDLTVTAITPSSVTVSSKTGTHVFSQYDKKQ